MQLALVIPAYNEEKTIENVIKEYREALPEAIIYVGDNNCADRTAEFAGKAGATVIKCDKQGKGNAVRHMFEVIDAAVTPEALHGFSRRVHRPDFPLVAHFDRAPDRHRGDGAANEGDAARGKKPGQFV